MNLEVLGEQKGRMWLFRGLGLVIMFNMPAFRLLFDPGSYDPMWMRWAIAGIVFLAILLSFFKPLSKKILSSIVMGIASLLSVWMLFLTIANHLHPQYGLSYIVLHFSGLLVFREIRPLLGFVFINILMVIVGIAIVQAPLFPPMMFFGMLVSLELAAVSMTLFNLREVGDLEGKEAIARTVSDAAFEMNEDAILMNSLDGKVLAYNQRLLDLWGLQKEDIVIGQFRSGVDKIIPMIKNQEVFEQSFQRASVNPGATIEDTLELLDGRIFSRIGKPLNQEGKVQARIWYFRDITREIRRLKLLEESRQNLRTQHAELIRLASENAFRQGLLEEAFLMAAMSASKTIGTSRTGIWLLKDNSQRLECQFNVDANGERIHGTRTIDRKFNPPYFEALLHERVIAIENTSLHPLTAPFVGLRGMEAAHAALDVPIRHKGNVVGVICTETLDTSRIWSDDEQHFLTSLGDLISLCLEANERKAIEAEKYQALAVVKAIFQQGGIGVLITGNNMEVIDFNEKYLEFWNMTEDFLRNSPGPAVVEYCKGEVLRTTGTGKEVEEIMALPWHEDYELFFLKSGRVLERQTCPVEIQGNTFGRAWIYRDQTDRYNAERRLFDSEQRNLAIVTALPDMILRLSSQGIILDYKLPKKHSFGQLAERLGNVMVAEVLPEPWLEHTFKGIALLQETGDIYNHDLELDHGKDKQHFEGRMVKSGAQEFLLFIRDVTERKETEQELIQRNFELDSFVYRASHDLKAPLNSLMGLVSILQDENTDPVLLKYLSMMDKSLVKLDTFIHNLNDFSRIARSELQFEQLDLGHIVQEIVESLQYMEGAANVRTRIQIPQGFTLVGDSFNLGIILSNLISNAIKYQDFRKPERLVEVVADKTGDDVLIQVKDNGVGVPKEYQDRLFELFFRASNQSFGSGLGLYITRNSVQKLGGNITMQSNFGEGTAFEVRLPQTVHA